MGNNLRIRGLNSRYILFLVDGERLVGEGAGGNINLDQIDVANIKRIEMINGAASVLYGSNAVGAVINVITKEPQEAIAAGCDISYQSNNTAKTRVHVESRQNKFLSQASIYRNSSDGFGAKGDGAYAASYADWGGNMKLGYKFNARTDVNVTGAESEADNAAWAARTDWDMAVCRYNIRTNSGTSSSTGANGGVYTSTLTFEGISSIPADAAFEADKLVTSSGMSGEKTVSESSATIITFKTNADGSKVMPPVYLKAPVYVFRTADGGSAYKVEFTQYQNEDKVTGHVKFRFAKIK